MQQLRPIVSALLITSIGFGVFFVILILLIVTTYTTSWKEEIWWLTYDSSPSLIGSLAFSVLLLFWWSLAISVSLYNSSSRPMQLEVRSICGSQLLMITIGVVLYVAWDAVEIENYHRYGNLPREDNLLEYLIREEDTLPHVIGPNAQKVNPRIYGVWELDATPPLPFLKEIRYLAFWRNEQYQFLDSNYRELESGIYRLSVRKNAGNRPVWESGMVHLFGRNGKNYYMDIDQGPDSPSGFTLNLIAGIEIKERIDEYYEPKQEIRITLINQRRVHSSHPVTLDARYLFYDEARRSQSPGHRINPNAMYP